MVKLSEKLHSCCLWFPYVCARTWAHEPADTCTYTQMYMHTQKYLEGKEEPKAAFRMKALFKPVTYTWAS